jgi:hypothetical protein
MGKTAVVFSIVHQIQGPNSKGYRFDPRYQDRIKSCILDSDFVFEEATGKTPTIASALVERIRASGINVGYVDIDPTPLERKQLGAPPPQEYMGAPITYTPEDGEPYEICDCTSTLAAEIREEEWVRRIQAQTFEKALVICGCAHTLSIARRLIEAEISVDRTWTYIPYHRVCGRCNP